MIRLGKTYGNLMVDLVATNDKLRNRVRRIVKLATGASSTEVAAALDASDGDAKVAIVTLLADVDSSTARERLTRADGVVRKAVGR
jgi:N-acetylmuramic acid 6-phosphate etherase